MPCWPIERVGGQFAKLFNGRGFSGESAWKCPSLLGFVRNARRPSAGVDRTPPVLHRHPEGRYQRTTARRRSARCVGRLRPGRRVARVRRASAAVVRAVARVAEATGARALATASAMPPLSATRRRLGSVGIGTEGVLSLAPTTPAFFLRSPRMRRATTAPISNRLIAAVAKTAASWARLNMMSGGRRNQKVGNGSVNSASQL
jgi:hypothetical protein